MKEFPFWSRRNTTRQEWRSFSLEVDVVVVVFPSAVIVICVVVNCVAIVAFVERGNLLHLYLLTDSRS